MALIGRIAVVVTFAALVALLTILAKPLWQGLNADSQTLQASKSSDRPTANTAPLNESVAPNTQIAAASAAVPATVAQPAVASVAQPSANAQQQASLAPASQQEPGSIKTPVRGVTDLKFGLGFPQH